MYNSQFAGITWYKWLALFDLQSADFDYYSVYVQLLLAKNDSLTSENETLTEENHTLTVDLQEKTDEYDELYTNYGNLMNNYRNALTANSSLQNDKKNLQTEIDILYHIYFACWIRHQKIHIRRNCNEFV